MKLTVLLPLMLVFGATCAWAETREVNGRPVLVLEGKAAQVVIDLAGGSIADFHRQDQGLNPLQWDAKSLDPTVTATGPRSMGHFLCLDRWGPPSDAESKNGMGWHGEATRVMWQVTLAGEKRQGAVYSEMRALLPMAGLSVRRTMALAEDASFFVVHEAVTNDKKLGRIYNMVQHPTIGPPFLDASTVVDTNARKGFMHGAPLPNPEEPAVVWPQAITRDGAPVNLRQLQESADPGLVSYVIDAEFGWVTASNAGRGLLLGYVWKRADYPWFAAWRYVDQGKPMARGLEFGTTGLHQPFPVLVKKGKIFDRSLYEYIDAGETVTRSYLCFLLTIPTDYQGVAGIDQQGDTLVVHERDGGPARDVRLEVGRPFDE